MPGPSLSNQKFTSNGVREGSGTLSDPLAALAVDLFFPDRDVALEALDDLAAGPKGLVAVWRACRDDDGRLADLKPTHAMGHRDLRASDLGFDRQRNLVQPDEMPFTNITNKFFDGGDYPEALRRAAKARNVTDLPSLPRRAETFRTCSRDGAGKVHRL